MNNYTINQKTIEFDSTKEYYDFFIKDGKQELVGLNLESLLEKISSGKMPVDNKLEQYMTYLQRWTYEAPRKRQYREMKQKGITVLSFEQFFDSEGGDKIIDNLENTGKFADYFLKQIYQK
jgi:hypothetical protein